MKKILIGASVSALMLSVAQAQQAPIKIGFVSTFSGPAAALGQDMMDGFQLGLDSSGGKLGGRDVQVIKGDDQTKPDIGRQQVDKMIESDKVQILTGIIFSNVMLAVARPALEGGAFVVSSNAGPSQYAGKLCNPHYFNTSFENDSVSEVMGLYMNKQSVKNVYLMAPNYPAGHDFMNGLKSTFTGGIAGEAFTTLGQLDYAADLAQMRAKKPQAVYFFYPGGMGINFVKQFDQAGMKKDIGLYAPEFSLDQTMLPAMGDAAIGAHAAGFWSPDFPNATNQKFVTDFVAKFKRLPSPYAAQTYDTARLLNAALTSIGGKIEDKPAFQKAMENVKFDTVRGNFKFNINHYPIEDYYLMDIVKGEDGHAMMKTGALVAPNYADSAAKDCKMATN